MSRRGRAGADRLQSEPSRGRIWQANVFPPAHLVPLVWVFLFSIFLFFLAHKIVDADLWHEMALAREILKLGYVPTEDLFAYTPTVSPSVHHEWGAGLLAYVTLQVLGESGLPADQYSMKSAREAPIAR